MSPLYERAFTNFLFSAEMLCAALLFFRAYGKRRRWLLTFVLGLAALGGATLLLRAAEDRIMGLLAVDAGIRAFLTVYAITLLSNLLLAGLVVLLIAGIYDATAKNVFFIAVAASTVRVIARCVFFLVCAARGLRTSHLWDLLFREPWGLAVYLLVYAGVFAGIYRMFIRSYTQLEDELIPNRVLAPLCAVVIFGFLFANVNAPEGENEFLLYLFLLLSELLISALILILQFFVLSWLQMQFQKAAMEQLYEGQQKQFMLSRESMDAVNINAHDLKHKVKAILGALDGAESERLREELSGITETISEWDSVYHTGCKPLDVVLTEKAQVCRQRETELSVIADGGAVSALEELDIYSLFSNALDNALEAVSKIPEAARRLIMVSVTGQNGYTVIRVENTFGEAPTFVNGALTTSKEDKLFHGFGVRSMENTVRKYGGQLEIQVTDELFCLSIVLPAV